MYSALSNNKEAMFFGKKSPVVHRNTLWSHFGGAQEHVHHFVDKDIIDVIIGDMFFDPDDDDITEERALTIFKDVVVPKESKQDSDLWTDRYCIIIKNLVQFCLIIGFISGWGFFEWLLVFYYWWKRRQVWHQLGVSMKVKSLVLFSLLASLIFRRSRKCWP